MTPPPAAPEDLAAVSCTVDGGIAFVTLDRPAAANARNQRMREDLNRVYEWIERDEAVRVVVLTGAGTRFFCAGMDLKEAGQPEAAVQRRERLRRSRDIERLAALPVPTIAAINGYAVGGGLEMALACDLRIAAVDAELGLPELDHGLIPGAGGTQRLPRLIGAAAATALVLLGERVSATRALQLGLVTAVVDADQLQSEATALAQRLAMRSPTALRAAKRTLRAAMELPLSAGLERELDELIFLLNERDQASRDSEDVS